MTKRIGILGGTFDPIHNAHIQIAIDAISTAKLDTCLLLPNHVPPHRQPPVASAKQRLTMLELVCQDYPNLGIATHELDRSGISFMSDTLQQLQLEHAQDELVLIIGGDSFNDFTHWHNWRDILKQSQLVVYHRPYHKIMPNHDIEQFCKQCNKPILWVNSSLDLSSTEVRINLLNNKKKCADELSPKVLEYIHDQGLYQVNPVSH